MWGALNAPESRTESSVSLTPWLPCPGPEKQRQSSQPSRFQSQYLLPGLQQQLAGKKTSAADLPSRALAAPGSRWVRWQMPRFSVFLALSCFAGSGCSPRRYIPICQSKRQQSNRVFLNNVKVLYLGVEPCTVAQRTKGQEKSTGFATGSWHSGLLQVPH